LTKLPHQILSLAFTLDESKGLFGEAMAPPAVLQEGAKQDSRENKRHIVTVHFTDSPQAEARILQTAQQLAAQHGLKKEAPQPNLIGLLGKWSARDLFIEVLRFDSLRQIDVSVEDYGRRESAQEIASELRLLPAVVTTRRFVSVNLRAASASLDSVIRVIEPIASKYGLRRTKRQGMFNVAQFESPDLHVSVAFFDSDSKVTVYVEDLGWHSQFDDIERALRSGLNTEGWR